MRVKISANPPLPPVRAWFPLSQASTSTVASFKTLLCGSLPAFQGITASSLRLSIDGFELLDDSELSVVRDGDLISIDARDTIAVFARVQTVGQNAPHATQTRLEPGPVASRKRKRRTPTPSSSESESDTEESDTESTTSSEPDTSDSDDSSVSSPRKAGSPRVLQAARRGVGGPSEQPEPQPETFVPPGYGKPQTRARNLRRRLKRMHEREAADASSGGPVSGANAVVPGEDTPEASQDTQGVPSLMSLSLRNKNKAKNFKALMKRPLPAKIIFGDASTTATPESEKARLIPPSQRSSLPPNLFVTSVDVEAGLHGEKTEYVSADVSLDYGEDVDKVESMANTRWATLARPTRDKHIQQGTLVGYKALGIDPVTYTPGQVLTVGRVQSCDLDGMVVRPLRAVSFYSPDAAEPEAEQHTWDAIARGDWRMLDA